ncbi:hypothetical protein [Hanstruepera marina]|uniref:hypothetical protein n=1 Tax=Hanstruepera marina TaxID=2873265 RepID=UPI00210413F1|nr:hypothetical protein [Hanstruepera marina]
MKSKILLPILMLFLVVSCKNENKKTEPVDEEIVEVAETIQEPENVIDIVTRSMEFQMTDTIPSGWNTFKYDNKANETHFFRFIKLPENISIENYKEEVDPVFEEGMDLINEGKPEDGFAAFGKLPEWFGKCVPFGGSGLIAPKHSTVTTLLLDPGNYIVECYVKMPNGKFHSTMGMIKDFNVSEVNSNNEQPMETETISVKEDGFYFNEIISKGKHIFKVQVESQKLHENFALTDVHLVELANTASLDALEAWMVWYDPKGFITPAPDGVTFLGGYNDDTEGSVGYFYADLKPGKYALIAEVPNAKEKGLFKVFNVTD